MLCGKYLNTLLYKCGKYPFGSVANKYNIWRTGNNHLRWNSSGVEKIQTKMYIPFEINKFQILIEISNRETV